MAIRPCVLVEKDVHGSILLSSSWDGLCFFTSWIWAHFVSCSGQFNVAEMICEFWGLHLKKACSSCPCPCRLLPETDMLWKDLEKPKHPVSLSCGDPNPADISPILCYISETRRRTTQSTKNLKMINWCCFKPLSFALLWPIVFPNDDHPSRPHPPCSSRRVKLVLLPSGTTSLLLEGIFNPSPSRFSTDRVKLKWCHMTS